MKHKTIILVTVDHDKPIPDLAKFMEFRCHSLNGIGNGDVSAKVIWESTPAPVVVLKAVA